MKLVCFSHWSDSDDNTIDCEIACDCVKRANVVGYGKKFSPRRTQLPTSRHLLRALQWSRWHTHTHTHLIIVYWAPRPTAWWGNNLRRWNCAQIDSSCTFSGRQCTLRHILNSCSVSLHQGRYSWRHNAVLSVLELKRHLLKFWDHVGNETRSSNTTFIRLVPEHAAFFRPHSSDRSQRPLFSLRMHSSSLWRLRLL